MRVEESSLRVTSLTDETKILHIIAEQHVKIVKIHKVKSNSLHLKQRNLMLLNIHTFVR